MTSDTPPSAGWRPYPRYPDPAIESLDPRFDQYRIFSAAVERLHTGCRWAEGPVWFGDGRYLLWSDIPNNRMLKWEEETGAVSVYRHSTDYPNGNTRDRQGRLVTCEHGGRRVTRTEYDGSITVLADAWQGRRLNSPNDVVVKSDGSVWFTDPLFGLLGNYEGNRAESETGQAVYRIDGATGDLSLLADDVLGPNGLCFSPDESILYLVESRGQPNRKILAYDVVDGGRAIANKRVLHRRRPRRHPRRDALRRRRQPLVRLGHGHRGAGRRAGVRARRHQDRPDRAAGALRQRLLRRRQAQPAVHGGQPVAVRRLRQHPGGAGRLIRRPLALNSARPAGVAVTSVPPGPGRRATSPRSTASSQTGRRGQEVRQASITSA